MASAFVSLARKWRPRRLADLVGQEYIVRALQNAAAQGRLHHALLFSGTRGVGKTTLARITAMLINCQARTEDSREPCLECEFCRDIMDGRLTDVVEQDAASHTQVDKIRDLLESALYAPARAPYKVFIIDEVHMLTKQSFNAMLKTLEEPPPHVKFILATTDPQKLPATVRSRCLCFSLQPLSKEQISARLAHILKEEGMAAQTAALAAIARLASGSMRDALSILDQAVLHCEGELQSSDVRRITGDIELEMLADILRAVAGGSAENIHDLTARHLQQHISFSASLMRLAGLIYKIALHQAVSKADIFDDEEEAAVIKEMLPHFSAEQLQVLYEIALRSREQLALAPDEATGFSMALLRMTLFTLAPATAATAQAPGQAEAPAAPSPPPQTQASKPAASAAEAAWQETLAQMDDEAAKSVAMRCTAEHYDGQAVHLVADESYAGAAEKYLPYLVSALRRRHGEHFQVTLRGGADNAAADAHHQALQQQVQDSSFFRGVKAAFPAAQVVKDSVREH